MRDVVPRPLLSDELCALHSSSLISTSPWFQAVSAVAPNHRSRIRLFYPDPNVIIRGINNYMTQYWWFWENSTHSSRKSLVSREMDLSGGAGRLSQDRLSLNQMCVWQRELCNVQMYLFIHVSMFPCFLPKKNIFIFIFYILSMAALKPCPACTYFYTSLTDHMPSVQSLLMSILSFGTP